MNSPPNRDREIGKAEQAQLPEQPWTEKNVRAAIIVNWNRAIERAAKLAEEAYLASEGDGAPMFQSIRRRHGAFIATKIRELQGDSKTAFLGDPPPEQRWRIPEEK